jgi:hypothetical protein
MNRRDDNDDDPPPDLQELVRQCGGYDRITSEAWAKWDRDNGRLAGAASSQIRTSTKGT